MAIMKPVKFYRRLFAKCGLISLSPEEQRKWLHDIVTGLAAEAQRGLKPKYFIGPAGGMDVAARHKLFDTDRMIVDFSARFPSVPKEDVKREVMLIHYYLLR